MLEFNIRTATSADLLFVNLWYEAIGERPPEEALIPDTSFICEVDEVRCLFVSLILTNTKLAWVENFIGNPSLKGDIRQRATKYLLEYLESFAKAVECKRLFCMAPNEPLRDYYEKIGFKETAKVFTLTKEIF